MDIIQNLRNYIKSRQHSSAIEHNIFKFSFTDSEYYFGGFSNIGLPLCQPTDDKIYKLSNEEQKYIFDNPYHEYKLFNIPNMTLNIWDFFDRSWFMYGYTDNLNIDDVDIKLQFLFESTNYGFVTKNVYDNYINDIDKWADDNISCYIESDDGFVTCGNSYPTCGLYFLIKDNKWLGFIIIPLYYLYEDYI